MRKCYFIANKELTYLLCPICRLQKGGTAPAASGWTRKSQDAGGNRIRTRTRRYAAHVSPHCTHRLRPLDRTYFKSLKSAFSRSCDNWLTTNKGCAIAQFNVIALFGRAYNATATVQTAVNRFATCGLWPFDDSKFDAELNLLQPAVDVVAQPLPQVAINQVTGTEIDSSRDVKNEIARTPRRATQQI